MEECGLGRQQLAIALVVVAVACVLLFVLWFNPAEGNKKALVAAVVAAGSVVGAGWSYWGRPTP